MVDNGAEAHLQTEGRGVKCRVLVNTLIFLLHYKPKAGGSDGDGVEDGRSSPVRLPLCIDRVWRDVDWRWS